MKDLYSVLGIDVTATPNDIREAYRKLSKKFHPDLNDNDPYFEGRFKEIREAYELLGDPVGRAAYDNQLKKFKGYPIIISAEPKQLGKGSINTKINWAFTAMLLVITSLFGYYVIRSVMHAKTPKVAATSDSTATAVVSHRKKRHHKKTTAAETAVLTPSAKSKPFTDTISAKTVKPSISRSLAPAVAVAAKPKPVVQPVTNQPQVKITPAQATAVVSAKPVQQNMAPVMNASNPTPVNSAAYIKANATGVVYMRQMNNYNSDVVSVIPGDTKIAVLEKSGNFCKISYNNKTGYVPNWTVQYR